MISIAFELVKVRFMAIEVTLASRYLVHQVRRQLEYSIASSKGIHLAKPPGTLEAVGEIFRTNGLSGLYIGFRLHFGLWCHLYSFH